MMQIHDDILETLGDTPLVRLRRFHPDPLPPATEAGIEPLVETGAGRGIRTDPGQAAGRTPASAVATPGHDSINR